MDVLLEAVRTAAIAALVYLVLSGQVSITDEGLLVELSQPPSPANCDNR